MPDKVSQDLDTNAPLGATFSVSRYLFSEHRRGSKCKLSLFTASTGHVRGLRTNHIPQSASIDALGYSGLGGICCNFDLPSSEGT